MAETKRKGDVGQSVIMAKIMLAGHKVAIPVGEDWRYDLIVLKDGKLQRVQCKYVTSDGDVVYLPSIMLGTAGRNSFSLRLKPSKNGQSKRIRSASDFENW